jgi:hypothetical protein
MVEQREVEMAGVEAKSMDAPDEVRTPDKTRIDVVTVGASEVGRFTFQPGWRWSECIKPVVGTDSCQAVAWVVGDEQFVGVEFKSAAEYAKG